MAISSLNMAVSWLSSLRQMKLRERGGRWRKMRRESSGAWAISSTPTQVDTSWLAVRARPDDARPGRGRFPFCTSPPHALPRYLTVLDMSKGTQTTTTTTTQRWLLEKYSRSRSLAEGGPPSKKRRIGDVAGQASDENIEWDH